jgi:hypothetical protein
MLKAVRASITSGVLSYIASRPKVVPLSSQSPTQNVLLLENGGFLLQENSDEILLEN